MSQRIDGLRLTIRIEQQQIDKLDAIAKRFQIPRNQALRMILDTGLDAYGVYEKVGVVKLAELTKKTRKALEAYIQPSLI
jgi:predicted DNA-binding ribbon-helix-helix protein